MSFINDSLRLVLEMQRVKVYRLNDDGKWDDQGTGHATVDYLEVCSSPCLDYAFESNTKIFICN